MKRNEGKNIMNAYRTPGVLLIVMAIAYFVSSILSMIGIESLSRTAIFGLYVPLALMVLWGYIKYSGNFSEAGQMIDNMAGLVWEEVGYLIRECWGGEEVGHLIRSAGWGGGGSPYKRMLGRKGMGHLVLGWSRWVSWHVLF